MARAAFILRLLVLCLVVVMVSEPANAAYQQLRCTSGTPDPGTTLYDDSETGACQFIGIRYIFSTIICQFVTMVNAIMGKLYCSIQAAIQPVVMLAVVVFVAIYGVQMIMGTAQLNAGEVITRVIKMCLVLWLVTDAQFGVSAGISYMFNFFMAFIADSSRWVVTVLDRGSGMGVYQNFGYNAGVTATFFYIDNWIYNALTGALSPANGKVIGFFVAMAVALPSIFYMGIYWLSSLVVMLIRTLISFLMAVVAIAFLLGLSPIFLSFLLFKSTFSYFDQWLRFMVSYALQVMVSFAILTLWLFSLTLFAPFFNELSDVLFPYEKIIRPATAIYNPADTWGLCPVIVTANPIPHVRCVDRNFNPRGPVACGPSNPVRPCYNAAGIEIMPNRENGMTRENDDYKKIIPPARVPELNYFLFYMFYHLISLIIVSYGFASLQKNSSDIARQLAGPSFVSPLNKMGVGNNSIGAVKGAKGEANRFMSKELFTGFSRRHEGGATPYEQIVHGAGKMASGR